MITSSPAEVLAAFLVTAGLATRPATAGSWPVTSSSMPNEMPDNRITIYNPDSEIQGKLHDTGETLIAPICQIRVRSVPASLGYTKLVEILNALSPVKSYIVVTNTAEVVSLVSATIISGPQHIGQEEKNQRQHHVLNVKLILEPGA